VGLAQQRARCDTAELRRSGRALAWKEAIYMARHAHGLLKWLALAALVSACQGSGGGKAGASASARGSAGAPSGTAAGGATAAAAGGLGVLGGADWKAVFVGAPPTKLTESLGGGQGTGMADDYTVKSSHAAPPWKFNAAGGGGVYWSPSKKAVAVSNINLKRDADPAAVDTWIKSALVTDVKHVGAPELVEVGPDKAVAKAGAGTCKLKGGEAADFYWWDVYSEGDFAHQLMMVVVAKDAPDDEKTVALSILRQVSYTPKAKPHYKK
jgi:hypothetical protein